MTSNEGGENSAGRSGFYALWLLQTKKQFHNFYKMSHFAAENLIWLNLSLYVFEGVLFKVQKLSPRTRPLNSSPVMESQILVCCWNLNPCPKQDHAFAYLLYKSFENPVVKGEIARNEKFLLFLQCFLPFHKPFQHMRQFQNCHLQSLPVWESLKLSFRKGLTKQWNFKYLQMTDTCDSNMIILLWKNGKYFQSKRKCW